MSSISDRRRTVTSMASLLLTTILLLSLHMVVDCADKELGEACVSGDNCVNPTVDLVCSLGFCAVKATGSCSSDGFKLHCVAGSACTSGTCTCDTTIYSASSGLCNVAAGKYAGACEAGNACSATDVDCDTTLSKCKCAANKFPKLSDGTCESVSTNERIGKACTDADKDTTCGTSSNLVCPTGGGLCACATDYFGLTGATCTQISNGKVGKVCTAGDKGTTCGTLATTHLDCTSGACACVSGYFGVKGGDCFKAKGTLGGGCSGANQGSCADSTSVCTGTPKMCKSGLGGTCATAADCSDSSTMACDNLKCMIKVDASCAGKTDKCTTGATCNTANLCKCDGTVFTVVTATKTCTAATGKAGGACTGGTGGTCTDSNAECNSGGRCVCKTGYKIKLADATCESGAIGVAASVVMVFFVAIASQLFTLH